MNKKIVGAIAVYEDAALNARLTYSLNTASNKTTYSISCYWKIRNIYGECFFGNYKDAVIFFDGLPAVSKNDIIADKSTANKEKA